jgi:Tol biopolymer transport system component
MTTQEQLDPTVSRWLEADAPGQMPDHVLRATFERTRRSRQARRWRALPWSASTNRTLRAVAGVAVVVIAIASGALYFNRPSIGGQLPSPTPVPTATSTATPTSTPGATFVAVPGDGSPLGWSSDGTRLLFQKGDGNLYVRHADESETQVTDQSSGFKASPGAFRPPEATISADGSRVVFAGLRQGWEDVPSCHYGALFTVDADGGPAELLWESPPDAARGGNGGIVRYPTFSPDGTKIAFVDGYCDHDHSVWIMNADGSEAHVILANETTLGAGHVFGLAWSAAGDRLAVMLDPGTYTLTRDGSDFGPVRGVPSDYCWPGWRC